MLYIIAIVLILSLSLLLLHQLNRKKKQKQLASLQHKWAKASTTSRNFNLIARYHDQLIDQGESISNEIAEDIDFEKVFAYLDRTNSKIGQQYLYHQLRKNEQNLTALQELDHLTTTFSDDDLRLAIEVELSQLAHQNAYYIHELFTSVYEDLYQRFTTFYIKIAGVLWITMCVLTITLHNQYLFLFTLGLTLLNFYLHFTNKRKITTYIHSLPQLYLLMKVAKNCSTLLKREQEINQSLKSLATLKKILSYINFQSAPNATDISTGLWELIKTLLLVEPAMFLISIRNIRLQKTTIEALFQYIAKIDLAISIQSLRLSLPYFSKPNFNNNSKELNIKELYHPLIEKCVPNSIATTAEQGTLITGSNMSGKTTFIRSIVINALVSQTLFTSFTKNYQAPFLQLFTSIRVSDSLTDQHSYFQKEAISILHILRESKQRSNNLIIIDEIFRGTNTIERVAAAKAILSYLIHQKNFVFVSTHDLELAELLGNEYCCYSFEETAADTRLVFDYKLKSGILKHKNGIAILAAMGYPQSVVDQATEISVTLKKKYNI